MLVARNGALVTGDKEDGVSIYPETCAECGGAMSVSSDPIPFELRGQIIMVPDIEHAACRKCGEMLLSLRDSGSLQRDAVSRVKAARGLLTADEIKALRRSLGLSQAAFERLPGTGPKTVVRWEKGTVFQSATADRLMGLMRELPEAVELLRAPGVREPASNEMRGAAGP